MILKDIKELLDAELNIFEDALRCHIAFAREGLADGFTIVEKMCRLLWHHWEIEKFPDLPTSGL